MNTPHLYQSPIVVPPVPCDVPSAGVPSDHSVPVSAPHTDRHSRPVRIYKTIEYRPLPNEAIKKLGQWITSETFEIINCELPPSEQAQQLQDLLMRKLNEFCPRKTFKLSSQDKAWMNADLKMLKRKKMREWVKGGRTEKYKKLAEEFEVKYDAAAAKYLKWMP